MSIEKQYIHQIQEQISADELRRLKIMNSIDELAAQIVNILEDNPDVVTVNRNGVAVLSAGNTSVSSFGPREGNAANDVQTSVNWRQVLEGIMLFLEQRLQREDLAQEKRLSILEDIRDEQARLERIRVIPRRRPNNRNTYSIQIRQKP